MGAIGNGMSHCIASFDSENPATPAKAIWASDGCPPNLTATVSFIARAAEFTPPVIYSLTRREKLVFLVEAKPDDLSQSWHPGLPVDVTPLRAQGAGS